MTFDAERAVRAVSHVGVSVADLDAARAFWVDELGAEEHGGFAWPVGTAPSDEALATADTAAQVLLLRCDAAFIELFAFTSPLTARRAPDAPGVTGLTWALPDDLMARRPDLVHCPDGTPVRLVAAGGGPTGLIGVQVEVPDPAANPLPAVRGPVRVTVGVGGRGPTPAAVDLGVNHLCLEVEQIAQLRSTLAAGVRWHHDVVASSGGIASVCYGTGHDGLLLELLQCHSPDALLSRTRLSRPDG
jgi:catechol 2,3-dioxygenase-like lactoylglutathione lyase family enzyme